jgi:hypothetical protein
MPSWKHRRRLIYLSFALSAITYRSDSSVSRELIIGGVALISIILTAYTAFATYEDVKTRKAHDEDI